MTTQHPPEWRGGQHTPGRLVVLTFLAIAAFCLIMEHWAHLLGVLPYVLVLLCPLLHLFMHGWHGRGHAGHQDRPPTGGA